MPDVCLAGFLLPLRKAFIDGLVPDACCCTLPDKHCIFHDMCLYQVMMTLHFLNDDANDVASTQNRKLRHVIASLKSETTGKLILNRLPGVRLLISSLPGSALRTHVESLSKPRDVNKRSQSLAW